MTNTDPAVPEQEYIAQHHHQETLEHQASSVLFKRIRAPVDVVWSTVRKFDKPQNYKIFVKSCVMHGDVQPGNIREVCVISGLPATTSLEMLEMLDDKQHIMCYRVLGGDHRLRNYKSVVTLHPETVNGKPGTLIIESFSVDVPDGNTKDDTKFFVEALIKCNLKTLADICEKISTYSIKWLCYICDKLYGKMKAGTANVLPFVGGSSFYHIGFVTYIIQNQKR